MGYESNYTQSARDIFFDDGKPDKVWAVPHGAQGVHRASARLGPDVSRGDWADRAIALHVRDPVERPWLTCHEVHHQPHQPCGWQRQAA